MVTRRKTKTTNERRDPTIDRILYQYNEDVKRHMSILREDFGSQVSTLGEQMSDMNKKLDKHSEILGAHSQKLDSHSQKLDSHTEMIAKLAVDVNEIKHDLKTKVDYDDFAKLDRRVKVLETKVARR